MKRQDTFLLGLGLLAVIMIGCEKQQVYEGVYEGLHNLGQVMHPANEPVPPAHPSYGQYKKEREETLKKDGEIKDQESADGQ